MSRGNTTYENDKLRDIIKELEIEKNVYYNINERHEKHIRKQDKKIRDLELLLNSRISRYVEKHMSKYKKEKK